MRPRHALAVALALAFLASLPAASAQAPMHSSALTAQIAEQSTKDLVAGQSADLVLQATRSCTGPGHVLPAGTLRVHVVGSMGIVAVTGPTSVALDQQVCAQQMQTVVQVPLQATARSDLDFNGTLDETVVFEVRVDASDPLNPPPSDAVVTTLFVVHGAKEVSVRAAGESQQAPAGGLAAVLGALGALAWTRRR